MLVVFDLLFPTFSMVSEGVGGKAKSEILGYQIKANLYVHYKSLLISKLSKGSAGIMHSHKLFVFCRLPSMRLPVTKK